MRANEVPHDASALVPLNEAYSVEPFPFSSRHVNGPQFEWNVCSIQHTRNDIVTLGVLGKTVTLEPTLVIDSPFIRLGAYASDIRMYVEEK